MLADTLVLLGRALLALAALEAVVLADSPVVLGVVLLALAVLEGRGAGVCAGARACLHMNQAHDELPRKPVRVVGRGS